MARLTASFHPKAANPCKAIQKPLFPPFEPKQRNSLFLISFPLSLFIIVHNFRIKVFFEHCKESLVRLISVPLNDEDWWTDLSSFLPAEEDLDFFS
jgi:hypothetical protein